MDINKLLVKFHIHYEKESNDYSKNSYLNYKPFMKDTKKWVYLDTSFKKKDTICYMRIKNTDRWLYKNKNKNKLVFSPIIYKKHGYSLQQPLPLWIKYLREPTFYIYTYTGPGITKTTLFMNYKEINNKVYITLTKNEIYATIFFYTNIDWAENNPDIISDLTKS